MKKNDCIFRDNYPGIHKLLNVMKLTVFLLLISVFSVFAGKTYSQTKVLNLSMNNSTVKEVLQNIEEQSEFYFMYSEKLVDVNRKVSVNIKDQKVNEVLDEVFAETDVIYKVKDRFILLTTPEVGDADFTFQQQNSVSGTVTDEAGQPLPGVTVVVKGTTRGVVTDADGNYSITNISENATLEFSFVGMRKQEVAVNGQTTINVTLTSSTIGVEEVVVTALGLKREKKALGYSVGEVKGKDLTETTQGNVINALAGKVSGVRIAQMDGTVGSSVNIIIRGATSLSTDNQPLFVIDGVPVMNQMNNYYQGADLGNAISDLNPDDIESVSVLKGASAAALYGSRAGNGVILITTRSTTKGKKGIGVSVNSSTAFDVPYDFYPYQTKFATGKAGAHIFEEGENETWGSQLDVGEMWVQWNSNGEKIPLVSYKNKVQDFMQQGYTLTNNIAFDGSNEKGFFRLSVGDMRNQGMIPNTDLKRTTINLNTLYKLSDKLSVTVNFNWNESGSGNRPNINGDDRNDIVRSLYEKGAQVNIMDLKNYWKPGMEGIQQISNASKQNNVWFVANENTNSFFRDRLMSKIQLDWKINNELSLMGRFSRDAYNEGRESKRAFSTYGQKQGGYDVVDMYRKETNMELNLNYLKKINDNWNFNGLLAANSMYTFNKYHEDVAASLIIPDLYTISNGVPGTVTYTSSWSEKAIYSVYGMASIDYKRMAFLDVTGRNDWSSTLPEANRSYFYPSASLSLLFSEMFTMPRWITYLKLRAGVAQVGNDTSPYALNQYFSVGQDWGTAKQMYMGGTLKNSSLKPEQAKSSEIGIDINMLKNRLGLEATYYDVQNKNQVLSISLPVESGATSKLINTGLIESKGWEIRLTSTPVIKGDFRWDLNFNFTQNKTWLKELAEGLTNVDFAGIQGGMVRTYEGGLIGDIWEYPLLRVKDKTSPYYNYPIISSSGKYQTDTDPKNMVKVGNSNQDFILGIQPTFTYKSFSLYANIDWNQGGEFYSITRMFMGNNGVNEDTFGGAPYDKDRNIADQIKANPDAFFGNWVGGRLPEYGGFPWPSTTTRYEDASFNPGVREVVVAGVKTYVENLGDPALTKWIDPFNANQAANRPFPNRNIYSSTYVKIRELALTYRLPKRRVEKIHFQNASVSVFATNIFEWTEADIHIDPERAYKANGGAWTQGVEYYNAMPWTGSVGFKLNFDF